MAIPLVSICLPNLNTRPFLEERMETILAQTFTDWELIISDNYSNDGSWEFFQKFKGDPRIRLSQAPREGMYPNWNRCLQQARGQYCYVATSDDTMSPHCIEELLKPLQRHPEIRIAVCDFQEIDQNSRPMERGARTPDELLSEWKKIPSIRSGKTEFLLHACFGTIWVTMTSVLFGRDILDRAGYFPTNRGSQGDLEWTLRASLLSDVAYLPERLATWRIHGAQATPNQDWTAAFVGTTLKCIEATLQDDRDAIPSAWKQIPDWDKRITQVFREEYYDSFRLSRTSLRRTPRRFFSHALLALQTEPRFFLSRFFRAFGATPEPPDRVETARELIRIFDTPWPPQPLTLS